MANQSELSLAETPRPIHPACAKWPMPSDAEFNKLVDDIRANGLVSDIWTTDDGAILDGKVREKACAVAGVAPRFQIYQGNDPVGFTISQNARRRHMPLHEMAFLVEELAALQNGSNQYIKRVLPEKDPHHNRTTANAAKLAGIGMSSVESARAIKRFGTPNVIDLAKTGKVNIRHAAAFVRHTPKEEQVQADAITISQKGSAISERSKRKAGPTTERPVRKSIASIKSTKDTTVTVSEVIEALRPLVKRIKEQSKQHYAMVSMASLGLIASAFEMIFTAWAQGDTAEVTRITRHIAGSYIRDGSSKANNDYFYGNQENQQQASGSDPGACH